MCQVFTYATGVGCFQFKFQVLILLANHRVAPEQVTKTEHSFDLTVAGDTDVDFMGSNAIHIPTIKMVPCRQIASSCVP